MKKQKRKETHKTSQNNENIHLLRNKILGVQELHDGHDDMWYLASTERYLLARSTHGGWAVRSDHTNLASSNKCQFERF